MRLLPLVAAVLLAGGCGGDDESSPAPATTAASECTPASSKMMTRLAGKVTLADARLTNGQIVHSTTRFNLYFVSAEIDSAELANSGDVATWVYPYVPNPRNLPFYSVNDLARRYSSWREADAKDALATDPAAKQSRSCVFR